MLGDETEQHRCEVCDILKDSMKIRIQSDGTTNSEMKGTTGTNSSGGTSDLFHVCPQLTYPGRRDDIQEVERWRLKNDPTREFSEETLDETIEERLEQERVIDSIEVDTPWDNNSSDTDAMTIITATPSRE
jgi:hypothetical protein